MGVLWLKASQLRICNRRLQYGEASGRPRFSLGGRPRLGQPHRRLVFASGVSLVLEESNCA